MSDSNNQVGERATGASNDHSPTSITTKKNYLTNDHKGTIIVYKECLRNHAASLGGDATDGCGEFMPSSKDSLHCSACSCHRNFHRKELEGAIDFSRGYLPQCHHWSASSTHITHQRRQVLRCHESKGLLKARRAPQDLALVGPNPSVEPSPAPVKVKIFEENGVETLREGVQTNKKRQRTKFTNEQKQRMLEFAEKAGWKTQRLDEGLVQQFCQEVGMQRRVLKVWMHNNKHHFVKKISHSTTNSNES